MARAKTVSWFNLVAGLVLGATTQPLFFGTVAHAGEYLVAQASGRATQAHTALSKAIECHRQGDYEAADAYFKQVLPHLADLTASEQEDFKHFSAENVNALAARQNAERYLTYAEKALAANHQTDAAEQLKKAAPSEQYMTPDDKQRLADLSQQLRVVRSAPPQPVADQDPQPVAPEVQPASTEQARAKVKQARAQMEHFNFEACQATLAEADALPATYAIGEDSPTKVREDLGKMMADKDALLAAARGALTRKEFDSAEMYAHLAEKVAGSWSLNPWSDSPAKVLRDVQAGRNQAGPSDKPAPGRVDSVKGKLDPSPYAKPVPPDNTMVTTNASPVGDEPADNTEAARKLLKEGRAALKGYNLTLAKSCALQARALKPQLAPGEDNPDKLLNDVVRAENPTRTPKSDAAKSNRSPRDEALELLRTGREQLGAMKIDDALKSAMEAKALNVKWGLFEDTPDTLVRDVEKARARHNQDESVRVLAEGRKLLDKKDYDGAMKAAYHAQTLHGTYYIWDLGDRPENLLADVEAGRAHQHKTESASPYLAKKDNLASGDKLVRNDSGVRPVGATEVQPVPPVVGTTPPVMPGAGVPPPILPTGPAFDANPIKPGSDTNRAVAMHLLIEARALLKDGKLIEARVKCLEAERLHVVFATDEESPGELAQKLTVAAGQRVQGLLLAANDLANDSAKPEAQRYQLAEERLNDARDLTVTFGLDTQMVETRLAWVRRMKTLALAGPRVPGAPEPAPVAVEETPRSAAQEQGLALLDKARMSLRSGKTTEARKQAIEAAQDQYAVSEQAFEVLREIEKEEFLQMQLQEQHKFMVVDSEFKRGDFANARAMLDTVNVKALSERQTERLKEIMQTPEMQPTPETQLTQATGDGPANALPAPPAGGAHVHVSDANPEDALLKATEAMRTVQYDKLRKQGMEAQRQAADKFRTGQPDAAIDTLQDYLDGLANEHLEGNQLAMLKRPVEQRLEQFRLLKERDAFQNENKTTVSSQMSKVETKKRAEESKQQRINELLKQYTALYRDHKYEEAEKYAQMALELDPDNGTAAASLTLVQRQMNVRDADTIRDDQNKFVTKVYHGEQDYGPYTPGEAFPKDFQDRTSKRRPLDLRSKSKPIDREVEAKLSLPVGMHFSNTPLFQAMDDLHNLHGINFWIDDHALADLGKSRDIPVSISLENLALKTSLTLLLKNVGLTHVIKDGVVQITTPDKARGNQELRTIQVADLVIPIENTTAADLPPLPGSVPPATSGIPPAPAAPASSAVSGGTSTGSPSGTSPFASLSSSGAMNGSWEKHKVSKTLEESLINLITSSIEPSSWNNMGGPGTIQYFGPTMSLVINQTVDIQDQIQDLLASLRALQDQEVAVEVRFITIADDFYERIGVDFNVDIQTNNQTAKYQPSILASAFSPQGFLNNPQFAGKGLISGLTPAGTLTNDLSIPINASSFNASFPQFGGYIPGTGGLDVGLAFLSDIQVFLFLEAVSGDVRTNVMTAPKLTLENGQTSTLIVAEGTRNFLASVNYTLMNNQIVAQPIILSASTNSTTLTIQAVISADRRFVRMNPTITLTNISNTTPTATIPLQLPLYPTLLDFNNGQQPVLFTEYLSAPSTNTVAVNTTVTVPDGGTVLMGGLKIMSEGRNEYGAPILSKIPYIDRLFRNTSYGRDSRSLMLMITPRIIIQSEEEDRQTGYNAPRQPGLQ